MLHQYNTHNPNNPKTVTPNLSIFTDFASKLNDEEILEKVQTPSEFFAYMRNKKERDEKEKGDKKVAQKVNTIEINESIVMYGMSERREDAIIPVDVQNGTVTNVVKYVQDEDIDHNNNNKEKQNTNNSNEKTSMESDRNKVQGPTPLVSSIGIGLHVDTGVILDSSILEFHDSLRNINMDSCHRYVNNTNNNDDGKYNDNTNNNNDGKYNDNTNNDNNNNNNNNGNIIQSVMQDKNAILHINEDDECQSDDSLGGLRQCASFQKSRLARIRTPEYSPRLVYTVKDKEKEKEKEKKREQNSSHPHKQGRGQGIGQERGLVINDFGSSESTVTIESALDVRVTNIHTGKKSFSFTTDKKSESDGVLSGSVKNMYSTHPYITLNSSPITSTPIATATPTATAVLTKGIASSNGSVNVNGKKETTQEVFALRSALGYQSTDGSPSSDSTAAAKEKGQGKGKGQGQGYRGTSLTDTGSESESTEKSHSTDSDSRTNYSHGLDLIQLANESNDSYDGRSDKEGGMDRAEERERERERHISGDRGEEGDCSGGSHKSTSFKAPYRYLRSKTLKDRDRSMKEEKNRSRSSSRSRDYDENNEDSKPRSASRSLSPPPPPSTHTTHHNDITSIHTSSLSSSSPLPSTINPSQPTPPKASIDSYFNDFISPSPPSGTARPVSPSLLHSTPLSPLYSPLFPNGIPKMSLPFNASSAEDVEIEIRRRMDPGPNSGMSHVTLLKSPLLFCSGFPYFGLTAITE